MLEGSAATAAGGARQTAGGESNTGLFTRGWLRAAVATIVTGVVLVFGGQPAMAAAVVQPGKAGNICGEYYSITSTLKYQLCTWASANGSQSRIWFTAHFSNSGNSAAYIDLIDIGYRSNGSTETLLCRDRFIRQFDARVPARGVMASTDLCWIPRVPGSYQADVLVTDGSYYGIRFSPTLNVR
jgi:hypothetical protein